MAAIVSGAALRPKEGQFLGGIAFDANPLTEKQRNWLAILLDRHGLAPLADGGEALHLGCERVTIQPRCSELRLFGKIEDSGNRRRNGSGKRAVVWVASSEGGDHAETR